MAAGFMASGYQAEFRFAIKQTGNVRRIERVFFPEESEADGNLRAVEELAGEGDHVVLRCAQDLRNGFALRKCAAAQGRENGKAAT
jgi:hypothetical protein